jgi:hypothetical protein
LRRRIFLMALLCTMFAAAGCSGGSGNPYVAFPTPTPSPTPVATPNPTGNGRVRVVHISPDAPNLDVAMQGNIVTRNLPYAGATGYVTIPAGECIVRLEAAGTNTAIFTTNIAVIAETDRTVYAVGRAANIQAVVRTDNNAPLPADRARLRLVHGASGLGNIDVYVTGPDDDISTGPPTAANLAFRATTSDVEIPSGAYRVRVTPVGFREPILIDTGTQTITSGGVYTGILAGDSAAGQEPAFVLLKDS